MRLQKHPLKAVKILSASLSSLLLLGASSVMAEQFTVTVENLTPQNGLSLTPVWVGFHDGNFDSFDQGGTISSALETLVEDGPTDPFNMEFLSNSSNYVGGSVGDVAGFSLLPILEPGVRASSTFDLDPTNNRYFSYATMVIPSNDAFIANEDPQAIELFDSNGEFNGPVTFIVRGEDVRDAGTELNNEMSVAFLNQPPTDPGAGTVTSDGVSFHPGFNGSVDNPNGTPQNILGGMNPFGFSFDPVNADFSRDGYQLARITISAAGDDENPGDSLFSFVLEGAQENPPVDTDASGQCSASLDAAQTTLTVECTHSISDAAMAHVHLGEPGVNGSVILPFDSAVSPMQQSFAVSSENVDDLLAGNLYVNVHSPAFGSGEIRGQIANAASGCDSGSLWSPARSGEGFFVELANNNTGPKFIVSWYTYAPDGSGDQVWIQGSGPIEANRGFADVQVTNGATFGDFFDPDDVLRTVWGTVSMSFFDNGQALVEYNSVLPDYGTGTMLVDHTVGNLVGLTDTCNR